ncbi:unnamed protein product [Trifolium pratense]|uniref:Uncharacterized protein n=1 Tax=Trifolium pratense TaxID=57577 RepID=A0ACB0KAS6_TRIPR|nr:unnamed protein product [Trifolium pratense]
MDSTEDLHFLLTAQRHELTAAESMESDLDFAYRLQLQEALAASLTNHPSSSSTDVIFEEPIIDDDDAVFNATSLQLEELEKMETEMHDREQSERVMREAKDDLLRRIHDQKIASEILNFPEEDWEEWGDKFEKPFGEGCSGEGCSKSSKSGRSDEGAVVRVYFKGLVSEESVRDENFSVAGIGVAVCDLNDNLIFEVSKAVVGNGTNKVAVELKALIEAFNAVLALDLKNVICFGDHYPLFQFLSGKWPAKQRKIAMLLNQVNLLQRKFAYCSPRLVARQDLKFALKLAKDAIVSQSTRPAESSSSKSLKETCVICLEDTDHSQFFSVDGCQHRYCFSCMKQHVEVKLLHGMVPICPHEGCKNELLVDSCRKFLTSKLVETMQQRKVEASIPHTEKIYCPYPRCSALMSKSEVLNYSKSLMGSEHSLPKKCVKCHGLFCFGCKVPWHSGMTCYTYKRLNPNPPADDVKLKFLASRSLWKQCVKCNHMIELAEGCYHMTCRRMLF